MIRIILLLVFCAKFYEVTMETKTNEGGLVMFINSGFTCNDGSYIHIRHFCNGKKDCSQNEDEDTDSKECLERRLKQVFAEEQNLLKVPLSEIGGPPKENQNNIDAERTRKARKIAKLKEINAIKEDLQKKMNRQS
ncbi:uncharacterized protein LOC135844897 [Planococcus citri]|uniref:uncharacterized protein LOC135844897 n=1 Tax=Planococcus citri TaxID=170843 RepID=UPI0031F7A689